MFRNEIDFDDLTKIIDVHMEKQTDLLMVIDESLKNIIIDYFTDKYGLVDSNASFNKDEYYVSVYWNEDGINYYVESARGISGNYKEADSYDLPIIYYIFTDMSEEFASKKLLGNVQKKYFCEFIDNEELDFVEYLTDLINKCEAVFDLYNFELNIDDRYIAKLKNDFIFCSKLLP